MLAAYVEISSGEIALNFLIVLGHTTSSAKHTVSLMPCHNGDTQARAIHRTIVCQFSRKEYAAFPFRLLQLLSTTSVNVRSIFSLMWYRLRRPLLSPVVAISALGRSCPSPTTRIQIFSRGLLEQLHLRSMSRNVQA